MAIFQISNVTKGITKYLHFITKLTPDMHFEFQEHLNKTENIDTMVLKKLYWIQGGNYYITLNLIILVNSSALNIRKPHASS